MRPTRRARETIPRRRCPRRARCMYGSGKGVTCSNCNKGGSATGAPSVTIAFGPCIVYKLRQHAVT